VKPLPIDIGILHFVGIGGIGMSGIAEVMHNLGYRVQGSDIVETYNVRRLRVLGIKVMIGHQVANVDGASVLVVSSAIQPNNPEVTEARARLMPVVRRAEMLAELMRLKWSIAIGGTHGKTTTTSMIAAMLDAAGLDPTVINGGIINAYDTNARLGTGDWMVVEADESDGSFTRLPATIAVVTNIDPEHMEFYGSFDRVRQAYQTFVENIPFYGFAVLCLDHAEVQAMVARITDRRMITYGMSPQAEVRAHNLRLEPDGTRYDVIADLRQRGTVHEINNLKLHMPGAHNVQNSLAAVAIGLEMGYGEDAMREAIRGFRGVKRRYTKTGEVDGVTIVDDYGHHPVEIAAVLRAGRETTQGRVIAVVQPHRYSRLRDLFEEFCTCFNDADVVIVADVYAAGEEPIEGINRDALVAGLQQHGHRRVVALATPDDLPGLVREIATTGDSVICLGAGSISYWANALPDQLRALASRPAAAGNGR